MRCCSTAALLLTLTLWLRATGKGDNCLASRPVVVLGDSLSSIGPGQLYSEARRSNGKLWVEYANLTALMDFALPGATATMQYAPSISNPRQTLSGQLQEYLSSDLRDINATCFAMFIGQNDVSNTATQLLQSNAGAAIVIVNIIGDIVGAVAKLAAQGGRCFFVFSLPDIMVFPAVRNGFHTYAADIESLVAMYNDLLEGQLATLSLPPGTFLSVVDAASAFNLALNGTAPNGSAWESTTTQCVIASQFNNSYDCGLRFWFDGYHPTTAAHKQLCGHFMQQICGALAAVVQPNPQPSPETSAASCPPGAGAALPIALGLLSLVAAWSE